ncbi:Inositol polyphosphate 5-phosphatase, putative [Hondaea fermentalgiana]|uniref:Inositol polyphosphate 5-phosphatase, putative n=1 Tax=Hondaea fermentalgiana TaxID=2315210 RepID=A0A2R5GIB1_9STRA|nr:Inositol polyphosphate 5-phosphatase, putative [Hondaea fermentalgiana]|eukprot:GBG28393.1 Inositol polyphosphate 5-phosphatase, putative [Hondaea fermentalgiana]
MPKLRILVGSWNVNAKLGTGQDLRKWLCKSATAPDIVAVSLQEIVQLSDVTTYVQNKRSEEASEVWARQFVDCLESHAPYDGVKYSVIAVSQLIGVMTCVLTRKEHRPKISRLMIGYYAVGRFGVLGNKGAVAIRFRLQTASHKFKAMCFVGSHLSAHQKEVVKRNADFTNIYHGLRFAPLDLKNSKEFLSKSVVPVETLLGLEKTSQPGSGRNLVSADDHTSSSLVESALGLARYATATFTDADVHEEVDRGQSPSPYGEVEEPEMESKVNDDFRGEYSGGGFSGGGGGEEDAEESLASGDAEAGSDMRSLSPSSTPSTRMGRFRAKAQNTKAGRSLGRISQSLSKRAGSLRPPIGRPFGGDGAANSNGGRGMAGPFDGGAGEDFSSQADLLAYSYGRIGDEPIKIGDHDMIFWFGDLNYRIDSFSWRETIDLVRQKNLHRLMEHDQLTSERAHERVFQDFHEGLINFVPTYKFQPGTNYYDTRGFKENGKKVPRTPSWCDRILWKLDDAVASNRIQQCSYFSCPEYLISDHKPVGAEFVLPFVELRAPNLTRSALTAAISTVSVDTWSRASKGSEDPGSARSDGGRPFSRSASELSGLSDLASHEEEEDQNSVATASDNGNTVDLGHGYEHEDDANSHAELEKKVSSGAGGGSHDQQAMYDEEEALYEDETTVYGEDDALGRDWYSDEGEIRSHEHGYASRPARTVIAIRDFNAREAEEISFRTGDLLELFTEEKIHIDDGWLLGRRSVDGSIGYFPASSVKALGAVTKSRRTSVGNTLKSLRKATALRYDRKKAEREHRMRVAEERERAYERELNRRQRLTLALRKALVGTTRKLYERRTWSMDYLGTSLYLEMIAKEDYTALDGDEISFSKGDLAIVVSICPEEDDDEGWYMARIGSEEGLVPRRCFEPVV